MIHQPLAGSPVTTAVDPRGERDIEILLVGD
jgi:hypothetical protein